MGGLAVVAATVIVLTRDTVTPAGATAGLAAASIVKLAAHAAVWTRAGQVLRPLRALPVRAWLREALPFLVLAVLVTVYYRAGVIVLHAVEGPDETAPYAAAMRVFDGITVLGGVGFAAVSPAISRMHRDRPAELWPVWRRMIGLAACFVVPGAAVLALAAHPLAEALFGARYVPGRGGRARLAGARHGLGGPAELSASVVLMGDERETIIRLTVFNTAALVGMVITGSVLFGSTGTAAATSLAELLSFTTFVTLV